MAENSSIWWDIYLSELKITFREEMLNLKVLSLKDYILHSEIYKLTNF
jgi:hypothetical protein